MTDLATWAAAHPLYWLIGLPLLSAGLAGVIWRALQGMPRGRRRGLFFAIFAALMMAVFLGLAMAVRRHGGLAAFDQALAQALNLSMSTELLWVLSWFTHLGDRRWLAALAVVILAALALRRQWRLAFAAGFTMAGSGALNWVLKHLFQRARPDVGQSVVQATGFSFPSGHTSAALAIYGFACFLLLRLLAARWQGPCVALTAALVAAIGVSRILLQVHFLSDVLAGLAVSALWLALCVSLTERWAPRR
ncbi:phosphatase PAP2 family protein [Bordetella trematum]|uniref:phosphatase PAP2 family protein n=1 Tax=Bordetella trematum TaxID=123899 RepID=UPI0014055AF7|nr:phosphatase PAP2 family protein [Bordetella trematum]QIM71982.1 phosphatase PAP2 family protein [Bordetella trematum]